MHLSQVSQLLEELDDIFVRGGLVRSHRCGSLSLLARLVALSAPGLELVDKLSKPVGVTEGVGLHGFFKPFAVLLRHGFEFGRPGAILEFH